MTRPTTAPPRWLLPVARLLVAVVGVTAIVLSYGALYDLAKAAHIDEDLAWLWPISVDVLAVVSAIAARVFHGGRLTALYAWTVLILFLGLSVWGNGLHAVAERGADGIVLEDSWARVVVSATPPVALALALHLLLMMGARYGAVTSVLAAEDEPVIVRPRPQDEQDGDQDEDDAREDGTHGEDGRPDVTPVTLTAISGQTPVRPALNGYAKIAGDDHQNGDGRQDGRAERPTPAESAAAVAYAERCAREGVSVTRDGLRDELKISNGLASALLKLVKDGAA